MENRKAFLVFDSFDSAERQEKSAEELYDQVRDRLFGSGSERAEPTQIEFEPATVEGMRKKLFGDAALE